MRGFTINIRRQKPFIPAQGYDIEIILNSEAEESFGKILEKFCGVEILQGEKNILANGGTHYKMHLDDFKGNLFTKSVYEAYFKINQQVN